MEQSPARAQPRSSTDKTRSTAGKKPSRLRQLLRPGPALSVARSYRMDKHTFLSANERPGTASSLQGSIVESTGSRGEQSLDLVEEYEDGNDDAAAYPVDIAMAPGQRQIHVYDRDLSSQHGIISSPTSPTHDSSRSSPDSLPSADAHDVLSQVGSGDTAATSIHILPALQAKGLPDPRDRLEPVNEDDGSYDLVAPNDATGPSQYALEARSLQIFSHDHLRAIFKDPSHLLAFSNFLSQHRPSSVPTLLYYLDAIKAMRAINYANAVAHKLVPLDGLEWSQEPCPAAQNRPLEAKAGLAFDRLVKEDLPAFVTHTWVAVVSESIQRRITGTLPPHLREASEGLAEVFCLTDPSRHDNPIVFASEEFHRTTQYGMGYVIGRNCRFLQGPETNKDSVRRLREAITAGKEISETFLNYRRDGSPFMNLLMVAPLRDSRGNLRYFIGAQVDVSGLAREGAELDALQNMLADESENRPSQSAEAKDEMMELSEMFNTSELETIKKTGGRYHRERAPQDEDIDGSWQRPRLLLKDNSPSANLPPPSDQMDLAGRNLHGKLQGIYSQYLLLRPYPSLRILFASPALRIPGILQSPFMNKIGSSERVREELLSALAEGRGVTAKVRWCTRSNDQGRPRWIHCTPLLGHNGDVGVWMVVLVDEDGSGPSRKYRAPPPVPLQGGRKSVADATTAPEDRYLRSKRSRGGIVDQRADPSGARSLSGANSRGNTSLSSGHPSTVSLG